MKTVEKASYLGDHKVTYKEKEREGEYAFIDGEWIWIMEEN